MSAQKTGEHGEGQGGRPLLRSMERLNGTGAPRLGIGQHRSLNHASLSWTDPLLLMADDMHCCHVLAMLPPHRGLKHALSATDFCSETDYLILEDEGGRMKLAVKEGAGACLPVHQLVTGGKIRESSGHCQG